MDVVSRPSTDFGFDYWLRNCQGFQVDSRVGRVGVVEDVGQAAVFLASDASDYVTGVTLYVDGGMTLYPGFESGG